MGNDIQASICIKTAVCQLIQVDIKIAPYNLAFLCR